MISDYYVILSQGVICVKIIAFDRILRIKGIRGLSEKIYMPPLKISRIKKAQWFFRDETIQNRMSSP